MKKLIPIFSFFALAACNQSAKTDTSAPASVVQAAPQPDTMGLAAYHAWKAQNELSPAAAPAPENRVREEETPAAPKTRVIYRTVPQKAVAKAPVRRSAPASTPTRSTGTSSGDEGSGSMTSESAETAKAPEKKKGMSAQTKGTIIGAAGGAAAGAIINKKNRAAGAVIGGVAGAIGGRVIGGKIDKKNGQ